MLSLYCHDLKRKEADHQIMSFAAVRVCQSISDMYYCNFVTIVLALVIFVDILYALCKHSIYFKLKACINSSSISKDSLLPGVHEMKKQFLHICLTFFFFFGFVGKYHQNEAFV